MRCLLDTCAFLWFVDENPQLNEEAYNRIEEADEVYLSIASVWEMGIKIKKGEMTGKQELVLSKPLKEFIPEHLEKNNIQLLPIEVRHVAAMMDLAFHHKDPFDRIIIAQGIVEEMCVISDDENFPLYPVKHINARR